MSSARVAAAAEYSLADLPSPVEAPSAQGDSEVGGGVWRSIADGAFEKQVIAHAARVEAGEETGPAPPAEEEPDPRVASLTDMGLGGEAVRLALAMLGPEATNSDLVDFIQNYERMRELGFEPHIVCGALVASANNLEEAITSICGGA
mmetsp:Transcript_25454/g.83768  ORF Transcript_25454/g.83768 Transcript_25454/m.83768 type:complete len:148 (+) Transcript_25454:107-550(+)|eukprot:CAMPEP_0170139894 /NCGR_PEP_ID=MMETSP0033_2-20121228/5982_1 /TAXON_ID=195969 /ORGANISM="Dolichomastix tenuilepis, Strain CCMP3274" /LENGTH=147 /DNA_ID=CAMNT_0010376051 /DNA_START=107 /DNA_END=550 /DNA_ORIENTATION=-